MIQFIIDVKDVIGDYDDGLINTNETVQKIVSIVLTYLNK
jgi:hypothetical protein